MEKYRALMDASSQAPEGSGYGSRFCTFTRALEHLLAQPADRAAVVVELGTTRSFVNHNYPGCLVPDTRYWEPDAPEKWDFGAGAFTFVMPEALEAARRAYVLHTVDVDAAATSVARTMTQRFAGVHHHTMQSQRFLKEVFPASPHAPADLIYMDTADLAEVGYRVHLEDAKAIVERGLLRPGGLILVDDVHNPRADTRWGKGKYSIPYLLEQGFKIEMEEYQVVLRSPAGRA